MAHDTRYKSETRSDWLKDIRVMLKQYRMKTTGIESLDDEIRELHGKWQTENKSTPQELHIKSLYTQFDF